jgi:2-amino-4-hydroxy-6-hydroxymethyldihydropteridine diphosphokinase
VNAVVELETGLEVHELLRGLLEIEQEFGRDRSSGIPNGPRTLDLDILLFGDLKICEPDLKIPHPRWTERVFVLVPLCEIAPQLVDAESGMSVSQLVNSLRKSSEGAADAVVPIQSDCWRAGAGRNP